VRFDADELEAWITAQRVEPANGETGDPRGHTSGDRPA
jgi:hypothetical protein